MNRRNFLLGSIFLIPLTNKGIPKEKKKLTRFEVINKLDSIILDFEFYKKRKYFTDKEIEQINEIFTHCNDEDILFIYYRRIIKINGWERIIKDKNIDKIIKWRKIKYI